MKLFAAILLFALALGAQNAQGPMRIGGNVMAQSLVTKIVPVYPPDMKAQHQEASVQLQVTISTEGIPGGFSVLSTDVDRQFIDASIDAVKQWRYRPVLLNGQPVEVVTTVTVNFTLAQ
jgi:protein TonB